MWFATIVAGLTVRVELRGVTSIVRALNLRTNFYNLLLDHCHSTAVKLDRLSALWAQAVLRLFPSPVRVNGRLVLVGDGVKIPKRGKKMPAVKLLHQQSESPSRPREFHPEPLTEPDVNLSIYTARATVRRLPPSVRIWSSSRCQLARSQRR